MQVLDEFAAYSEQTGLVFLKIRFKQYNTSDLAVMVNKTKKEREF